MRDKIEGLAMLLFPATCVWYYVGAITDLMSDTEAALILITFPINLIVSIVGGIVWWSPRLDRYGRYW